MGDESPYALAYTSHPDRSTCLPHRHSRKNGNPVSLMQPCLSGWHPRSGRAAKTARPIQDACVGAVVGREWVQCTHAPAGVLSRPAGIAITNRRFGREPDRHGCNEHLGSLPSRVVARQLVAQQSQPVECGALHQGDRICVAVDVVLTLTVQPRSRCPGTKKVATN